ncbi:O-acetylserine/cysteine efflux transporter [Azospirillum agricola]|uniref:EamA family transporter n=1 Tax=Azospirillum agricola TaxID=1720247 RepID=UPI001AEB8847|nr:EamA family transporter [Azospirillum agricola]MBP2230630.1 O-acetylserine/cysteine efflux transporter [Azospirillum agricola]
MRLPHILLAVAVAAVWGVNFVAIKLGLRDLPPFLFTSLRFMLASLPVLALGMRAGPPIPWRYVVGIGVPLGAVQFPLLFLGMDVGMPAGLASLVLQSQAFFTALFAVFALGDRPGPRQIAGMLLAFAGIGLIATEMPTGDSLLGLLLTLAAAASWGLANIVMKKAKAPDLFRMMAWVSLIPPLPLLALSFLAEGPDRIAHAFANLTWVGIGALVYIAAGATLFGFAAWGFLMRHYPASLVAPFSLLVPLFGMSSSALLLGETFTALKLAGGLLVFCGLALSVLKLPALARAKA